jgi:hypothetical protein
MKSSTKIVIGVIIAISFILGFFIGITIDYPKTNNSELAGTIGKMSNYRNVKVTDNDIELRSELLTNDALLKNYRQFFAFHYTACVKLCDDIDFAIQSSEDIPQFREDFSMEIENVKQFRQTLEQARKDILLAITALQQLTGSNEKNISEVINNANIAVAQIKYKQDNLLAFVESIERFLSENNSEQFSDLVKAHDQLALNQLIIASATNDKPMMKVYNHKQLLTSKEELKTVASNEQIKTALQNDFNGLQVDLKNNDQINVVIPDAAQIGNYEKQLGIIIPSIEKLGVIIYGFSEKLGEVQSNEKLGKIIESNEKLGNIIESNEKLGNTTNAGNQKFILNTEKLGALLNSEKLGIENTSKLGCFNLEKLGVCNVEKLNIY